MPWTLVTGTLLLLGVGFLVANAAAGSRATSRFLRRRRARAADLAEPASRRYYALALGARRRARAPGVRQALFVHRQAFGEAMMFVYYALPLAAEPAHRPRLLRGRDLGRHAFIPYNEVGGISWREGEHQVSLIVISRLRNLARRLAVPGEQVRRGAPPAARQDRRARDPFHRHRPGSRGARRTGRSLKSKSSGVGARELRRLGRREPGRAEPAIRADR